jgi:hypothetical protein
MKMGITSQFSEIMCAIKKESLLGTECDSCGCAAATDEKNGDRKTAERAVDHVAIMSDSARYESSEDLSLLCP